MAQVPPDPLAALSVGPALDITSQEWDFDEVGGRIQENLDDAIVKEALAKGIDLRISAREIEEEMRVIEGKSVEDYVREARNMAKLYRQVNACDKVLMEMETTLSSFHTNLAAISGEIESLQLQSQSMSVKLRNRKDLHGHLAEYLDGLAITPELIDGIMNVPVSEAYIPFLKDLDKKLSYIAQPHISHAAAVHDVRGDMEVLLTKAAGKISAFILGKILACRKPMANIQLQQNDMLKLQYAYRFLYKHARAEADVVRDEYADTIGKIHITYYKEYLSRLLKYQFEDVAEEKDLIAADDTQKKRGLFNTKPKLESKQNVFAVGNRASVLTELEAPILVPHTLEKIAKDFHLTYEQIFRNVQFAFMDNATREYLFGIEFFGFAGENAYTFFRAVMGKIMVFLLGEFDQYVDHCFDAIGLLLCAKVIQHYKGMLGSKSVMCLDAFYDRMSQSIWPRFTFILQANLDSVKKSEPTKLSKVDTRPHFIVRRFAEYVSSILVLDETNTTTVIDSVERLRDEVVNFILRMAAFFDDRREQLIFLINNYDLMLSVFAERGKKFTATDEFQKQLESYTDQFAIENLQAQFGGIMSFVKETENILAKEKDTSKIIVDNNRILTLNRNFAKDWKGLIEMLDKNIMLSFTNFKNGTLILQKLLTNLLEYYDRYIKILKTTPFRRSNGWPDVVDPHHLMVEVKKHRTNF